MVSSSQVYPRADVTGIVLAGGEGRRMGGVDKGLIEFQGKPMVSRAIESLKTQCETVLVNANRNLEAYHELGVGVVPDEIGEFFGPLAGMASAMRAVSTPYTLFAPCDSPMVTKQLGPRLFAGLTAQGADIAVAHDGDRYHPVFALMKTSLVDSAFDFLHDGQRKIDRWFDSHTWIQVDFSDVAASFANINRPEDRDALEAQVVKNNVGV